MHPTCVPERGLRTLGVLCAVCGELSRVAEAFLWPRALAAAGPSCSWADRCHATLHAGPRHAAAWWRASGRAEEGAAEAHRLRAHYDRRRGPGTRPAITGPCESQSAEQARILPCCALPVTASPCLCAPAPQCLLTAVGARQRAIPAERPCCRRRGRRRQASD